MPRPSSLSARTRVWSVAPLVLVLLAAGAYLFVKRADRSPFTPSLTAYTVSDALTAYRAHPGLLRDDIAPPQHAAATPKKKLAGFVPPAPGVYLYESHGQDWVEYGGQKYPRTFPTLTPATVHRSEGCVWELYFQAAKQYTDAHRQCSEPGEFLCLAHIQEVTFGSVHQAMTHRCDPPMTQVGGAAVQAGGREQTVCYATASDPSTIVITFLGSEPVTVAGSPVPAYHVRLDSSVVGEFNGTAVADVWFDAQTGMYLKMTRSQNTWTKLDDGSRATYRVEVTYTLTSLTPQT